MSLMKTERDPNGPTTRDDVYESGELNARLVTLKVLEPGEVVSRKLFTQRIMNFPLIHNDLCRIYVRLVMPNNNRLFYYFIEDPSKLTKTEYQLALELIVKEFVDFCFCEISLNLWPGLNCSAETIWQKPEGSES